ncbi:amino acid adenylation domain-containing protein [Streptomyces sp. DSM 41527]|uniref:PhsC n=2 Tax=Streptomyces TaxID=1883 RepID=A0A0M3WNJ5_STRHY|nr:amino acid adenylation domain-containing protein [Streptomyces sp. DSM 41527]AKN91112.1 PhsC [Streptomyces hygroscopicus]MDT0457032.1 amino acid adenylation domain-containing protein [Streptomyces sp. DSM 41527]
MEDLQSRIAALPPKQRALFESRLRAAGQGRDTGITRRPDDGRPVPLSFAQHRLWFLDQLEPGRAVYNVSASLRLRRPVSTETVRTALGELTRRHETLRTTFPADGGEPRQSIAANLAPPLTETDLRGMPESARAAAALRLCGQDKQRPFDLASGPLLRCLLLRLRDDEALLFLTFHHTVFDGWSIGLLRRDLNALLHTAESGEEAPLPPLPVQYADFADWQRRRLDDQRLAELLDYWQDRMRGAPPAINLPFDHPRPAEATYEGARRRFALSAELTGAVRELAARCGATPFMALLALFAALLHRWSGERDMVIGTPVANRAHPDLENLIGFFANTLAMRVQVEPGTTFEDLLAQVRQTTVEALARQDLPFERLVEQVRTQRSLTHNPLFQVAFVMEDGRDASELDNLLPGRARDTHTPDSAKFDLTLVLTDREHTFTGYFEYSSALFDPVTIDRLTERLELLARAITTAPDRDLATLPVLTRDETGHLRQVNAPVPDDPRHHRALHQVLEEAARRHPANTAVEAPDRHLTYRELDTAANRLAHHLVALGVGPEQPVGVALDGTADAMVATFGVLKAGAVLLPLDPEYPPARLADITGSSGVRLLLTQRALADRFAFADDVTPLLLDDDATRAAIAARPERRPEVSVPLDRLAYLIFTSGSTGSPKGVMVPHRGIGSLTRSAEQFAQTPDSRVLRFASPSFDVSLLELLMTFDAGATLVVEPRAELVPGDDLAQLIRDRAITTVLLSPSALSTLTGSELPGLRTVVMAGEAATLELAQQWCAGREVFNGYGPTEATVLATIARCTPDRVPPLGRPVVGYTVHVLDDSLRPVPFGRQGELYLGGVGLARGYLGRPEATGLSFRPDPVGSEPGARLYRTGDLVRWGADGELEFLGRADHQVKLRGFRIELGEIESRLEDHPGVRAAVAQVRGEGTGRRLVGYAVPAPGAGRPTSADLRQWLKDRLPGYMIPELFVLLDALPTSPNGKLDRDALPDPLPLSADSAGEGRPALDLDPVEAQIAEVWREVLGIALPGGADNFFEVGGNSLSATRVIARVNQIFGTRLPVRTLFMESTVSGLAKSVTGMAAR